MIELPQRFHDKYVVDPETGCHVWTAAKTADGYGLFWLDGRAQYAHRVSFASVNGPIPDGMHLDHLCRNRACVNPAHLEVVTNRENYHRGMDARNGSRDVCPRGHALTSDNLVAAQLARGKRTCLTCNRERTALRNAVASALGKSWGIPVREARKDPRVKALVRATWNWRPSSAAEAEELAELVDVANRIESGRRLTKRQKIAAVYRAPA